MKTLSELQQEQAARASDHDSFAVAERVDRLVDLARIQDETMDAILKGVSSLNEIVNMLLDRVEALENRAKRGPKAMVQGAGDREIADSLLKGQEHE